MKKIQDVIISLKRGEFLYQFFLFISRDLFGNEFRREVFLERPVSKSVE